MVAESVLGYDHLREHVRVRRVEGDHAQLDALGQLKRLGVLVVPLLEPLVVELDGVRLLLVLGEARDPDGERVGHVVDRLLDLHRGGPHGGTRARLGDLAHREAALEELLEALGRKRVLPEETLVEGEAELSVLLERAVGADRLRDLRVRRLEPVAPGRLEHRADLPRLAVDLAGLAAPVAVLPEAAQLLGDVVEERVSDALSAERPDARRIAPVALVVPQEVVDQEVERKRASDDDGKYAPNPLVANQLVELQDNHFVALNFLLSCVIWASEGASAPLF